MEATFQKISKGKTQERHFVLFNDCIVYARIVVRGTKRQYQFRDKLDLAMIVCDDQALNHSGFPADRTWHCSTAVVLFLLLSFPFLHCTLCLG